MQVEPDDTVTETQGEIVEGVQDGVTDETDNQPTDGADEGSDEGVVVTIGDEAPAEEEFDDEDSGVVKGLTPEQTAAFIRMRQQKAAAKRKAKELEQRINSTAAPAVQPAVVVGEKPILKDFEYDEEAYGAAFEAWQNRKRAAEEQAAKAKRAEEASQESWKKTLASYETQKSALKVENYEDAESAARDALNITQQGVILSGTDNPALVIYALGKNPKVLKELSAITDPVKFAVKVGKLEKDLKVQPRKTAPVPERVVRGSGSGSAVDSTLDRLRAEADKTGDRTKVAKYMREQAAKRAA